MVDIGQKVVEPTDPKPGLDINRRRQGRGRGHAVSGRGRGSRVNGQARAQSSPSPVLTSNGLLENSYPKVCHLCYIFLRYLSFYESIAAAVAAATHVILKHNNRGSYFILRPKSQMTLGL